MDKLTMLEAKAAGLTRYFTGVACPHGHIAERFVSTRGCTACAREKKHAWNAANPEKVNAQKRAYCKANSEKVKAWKSAEQKRNRAAANVRNRRYAATHREFLKAKNAAYQQARPEMSAARTARYLTAKRKQCPAWADHDSIAMIYRAAEVIRTTGFDVHVDHIIPLQGKTVTGLHVHNNLQIIAARANRSKSNSFERI